jgi:hypothetical protein
MLHRRVFNVLFSCSILFFLLSCQLFSLRGVSTPTTEITTLPSPLDDPNIENIAQTEEAILPQIVPTRTAISEEVGDIQVDYVYTDGLVTSLYHLYGTYLDHFVDISLTNNSPASATIIVETYIDGYSTKSTNTVNVGAGEQVEIHQDPRLTPEAVDRLNSEQPGNFHIRVVQIVAGEEKVLIDESQQILLYSRRDFVWINGFETNEEYELWAAWVTPTDPGVEGLIRAAADYIDSGTMGNGYGGHENDDDGAVWKRLEAIWNAEKENYRLTYISTMVAFGPKTVQRMRLPGEVLDQSSGNCIELAVLFASAAEALKLETAIIRIPGHAYTAVRMDDVNANYYFIETTMIGQSSFSDAVSVGKEEWNDAIPHFDAKEEGYAWVTIQDAWKKGILPIPWK